MHLENASFRQIYNYARTENG